jgi:hypothetical protein
VEINAGPILSGGFMVHSISNGHFNQDKNDIIFFIYYIYHIYYILYINLYNDYIYVYIYN